MKDEELREKTAMRKSGFIFIGVFITCMVFVQNLAISIGVAVAIAATMYFRFLKD
jgi:hypothetical protein